MADREFTGVHIEKNLYFTDQLNWTEKILLVEINSLDNREKKRDDGSDKGCFASNEFLGRHVGISEKTTANLISKLKKEGWIKQLWFDGRNRGLRADFSQVKPYEPSRKRESNLPENGKAASQIRETEPSRKREHSNTSSKELRLQTNQQVSGRENESENPPARNDFSTENLPPKVEQPKNESTPFETTNDESDFAANQNPAIEIYTEIFPTHTMNGFQVLEFEKRLPSVNQTVWRKVLTDWKFNGHRGSNLSGIIDRYEKEMGIKPDGGELPTDDKGRIIQKKSKYTDKEYAEAYARYKNKRS